MLNIDFLLLCFFFLQIQYSLLFTSLWFYLISSQIHQPLPNLCYDIFYFSKMLFIFIICGSWSGNLYWRINKTIYLVELEVLFAATQLLQILFVLESFLILVIFIDWVTFVTYFFFFSNIGWVFSTNMTINYSLYIQKFESRTIRKTNKSEII